MEASCGFVFNASTHIRIHFRIEVYMKNKLIFYPFVIACSIVSFSVGVSLDAVAEDGVQAVKKEEKQEIVSYKEVFKSYYNMIAQERENPTKNIRDFR